MQILESGRSESIRVSGIVSNFEILPLQEGPWTLTETTTNLNYLKQLLCNYPFFYLPPIHSQYNLSTIILNSLVWFRETA